MIEAHKDPLVELVAKTLWESDRHALLASAGHTTVWEEQPKIIKRDLWRKAIKVLAVIDQQRSLKLAGDTEHG